MQKTIFLFIVLLHCLACSRQQNELGTPNIILILTDDQGIGDIGYLNNPFIQTPHLDRLASEGVRLNNFYVSPVCSPTRASLLTGRYFIRTGIYDTFNGGSIMDTREVTLAEHLKQKGYSTGVFGKWHLGDHYPSRPIDQGFDEALVHKGGGVGQVGDIDNYHRKDSAYFNPVLYQNDVPTQTQGYCSDVYTNSAIDFIRKNTAKPFFMYLAFNAPHVPLQVPETYYDFYQDLGEKFMDSNRPDFFPDALTEGQLEAAKRVYGMVTNIDDNVGRVVETLKNEGIEENTLIIFLSDNGPQQTRYKLGLRGLKSDVYEGGIRVPCFFYYKGLQPGEVDETLAHIDMLPTLLDFLGVEPPDEQVDGKSFWPLLQGEKDEAFEERPLYFHWQRNYPEPYRNIAVRKGNYKLIGHAQYDADIKDFELFNLAADPSESKNIVLNEEGVASALKSAFDAWYKTVITEVHVQDKTHQKIIIGSEYQPRTLLNRNDAHGVPVMWEQEDVYGYWNIGVAESGYYDFTISFLNNFPGSGQLILKMAPFQRTLSNEDTTTHRLNLDDFYLEKGTYQLESWYLTPKGKPAFPFSIEINRKN